MTTEPTTERVRTYFERLAPKYDRSLKFWERVLSIPEGRRWIGARASGDVLEIGVGTGLNLPFYGAEARLTRADVSRAMLALARERRSSAGRST